MQPSLSFLEPEIDGTFGLASEFPTRMEEILSPQESSGGKFLLNGFVWLGFGGCSGLVVADDCICGDGFYGGLCATVGSLSIDPELPSIVKVLSKRAICVLDGGMSRVLSL
ncbi:hypothetical protein TIFTF001_045764 [Ficus carica]|uniref:Uncharacterized protein n=1 Tax=Ficus carica TaxID=3494 RepID=A0AA87ZBS1_FICCA|nr:hypothetical protein TIFTF001_045761 [Ficus carica]GMN23311.1 hypothetical protein TIFTF001_045762 [Ficus carica]GMN23326.1 hypothetical protein TIFTF001_045763 [Ficus carica]GMN23340.1 hypothetical protein TIFTF001_045764 [Ficus carica]